MAQIACSFRFNNDQLMPRFAFHRKEKLPDVPDFVGFVSLRAGMSRFLHVLTAPTTRSMQQIIALPCP
jgi:hypothetical protein